jgi:hypothetical protein
MSEQYLDLSPEHQSLLDEVGLLREELVRLLTEEHSLLTVVKPNLLALYQTKLGAWEMRALTTQINMLRTRRRLEMVQAAINQGESPDPEHIETLLESEFASWQQQLREATERFEAARLRMAHLLTDEESKELKKLYYSLAKQLHPDVQPNLSEDQRRLWLRVQLAYEHSDLEELKALALLAKDYSSDVSTPHPMDALRRDREVLRGQIAALLQRIESCQAQPPFTLAARLEDVSWLLLRRQELDEAIKQNDARRMALEEQLGVLLHSSSNGTIFGSN